MANKAGRDEQKEMAKKKAQEMAKKAREPVNKAQAMAN